MFLTLCVAGVAQVAAEEHHRPVEQAVALLLRLLQLGQEVAQGLHLFQFERLELGDLARVLAVVRQVVMAQASRPGSAARRWCPAVAA